ncbi:MULTISPECIES: hypothetical protein [Neobacillus]|nr:MULTISPECIES: hypothetical protein [Neobacillus]
MKKQNKKRQPAQGNTQSQEVKTLKTNDNIKDYSRAWEDDRL